MSSTFRPNSDIQLNPGFLSLGLPASAFGTEAATPQSRAMDTVRAAGPEAPDLIWIFRGGDFYGFDLRQGRLTQGPSALSVFPGARLPVSFDALDAATWGGPGYPTLGYYFRGPYFCDVRKPGEAFKIDSGAWGIDPGSPFADGVDAAIHGIGIEGTGKIHFFKDSLYARHNLATGKIDLGPTLISKAFPGIPEPFASGTDSVFYGAGDRDNAVLYFVKGGSCLRYDLHSQKPIEVMSLDARFPPLARFLPQPQLFFVEEYNLQSFVGNQQNGAAVGDAIFVPAGSKKVVTTQVTKKSESSSTFQQQILHSTDTNTLQSFYNEAKSENRSENATDDYRYGMDASFHGDASVDSPWNGEVNASVKVRGTSDDVRSNFAQAAFGTVQHQSQRAAQQVNQTVTQSTTTVSDTTETIYSNVDTLDRTSFTTNATFQAFAQLEPYILLLVMKGMKLAYLDGNGTVDIVELGEMDGLLARRIPFSDGIHGRASVRDWIVKELRSVKDYKGTLQEVVDGPDTTGAFHFKSEFPSTYDILNSDGTHQTISVSGLIKQSSTLLLPKFTLKLVDVSAVSS